jgi:regulator of sigma E protease
MPTLIAALASVSVLAAAPGHSAFSLIGAFLGIGFLIFVHELGHFLACRLTGTRVETFSIGFGPRLFGWESRGGTRRFTLGRRATPASEGGLDFRVSAVPLGGYVKMAGEVGGDGSPGSVRGPARPPRSDEYPGKPFRSKAFIISAGVLMNFLAAIVLYAVAFGAGIDEMPPLLGQVETGGAAWEAGLREGDRVVSFDGSPVSSFEGLTHEIIYARAGRAVDVVVERDGRRETLTLVPRYSEETGHPQAGLRPAATWTVDDGASPKWRVGPTERVLVDGHPAVGGYAAATLTAAAAQLGRDVVRIEKPASGEPGHDVRIPQPGPGSKPSADWKIGVAAGGPVVVKRVQPGGEAAKAGLRDGDRILAVDGVPVEKPSGLRFAARAEVLRVARGSETIDVRADARDAASVDRLFASLHLDTGAGPAVVVPDGGAFADGKSPAAEAGVRAGDTVLAVDGKPVATWDNLLSALARLSDAPVVLRLRSPEGPEREATVRPKLRADTAPLLALVSGDALEPTRTPVEASGPVAVAGLAVTRTARDVRDIGRMIRGFFRGDISAKKSLGGPGTIVTQSSTTAREGWGFYLAFLAFISVNLAVLNILPIPLLDGGSMALLLVEKARRGRPLKEATVAWFQWAGLALLLTLMYFAISNDVRFLSR